MESDNTEDRIREIRKKLIHAQVMFERAERASGAVAQFLREHGAPAEVTEGIQDHEAHALQLSYRHMRAMLFFEKAMMTGTSEDFRAFIDAFLHTEPA